MVGKNALEFLKYVEQVTKLPGYVHGPKSDTRCPTRDQLCDLKSKWHELLQNVKLSTNGAQVRLDYCRDIATCRNVPFFWDMLRFLVIGPLGFTQGMPRVAVALSTLSDSKRDTYKHYVRDLCQTRPHGVRDDKSVLMKVFEELFVKVLDEKSDIECVHLVQFLMHFATFGSTKNGNACCVKATEVTIAMLETFVQSCERRKSDYKTAKGVVLYDAFSHAVTSAFQYIMRDLRREYSKNPEGSWPTDAIVAVAMKPIPNHDLSPPSLLRRGMGWVRGMAERFSSHAAEDSIVSSTRPSR